MNTTQNIGLTDITTVELGNSTIGEDINSRFENIHNNFNVLSTTDYLKGDKGNSVKIIEFPIGLSITDPNQYPVVYEQNDLETPLTPEKLYNDLVLIITRESENETQTPISELNGLGENGYNKINLICEEVVENGIIKNILKGSLPFLYLDPNFSKGENLSTDKQNYSCLIIYGNNGFKKSTSIPKLYYDKNIEDGENNKGSFCWEINGHQTGIIAQGPQGKNGRDGNCYIVKLGNQIEIDNKNFDEDAGFYEIKQVFVSDENYIGWMDYEDFKENGNRLSIGSSCMCIFETDEYKLCFGVVAETGQDMERVIGVYTNLITNLVDFGSIELLDALSNISSNSEAGIRGLFVPYTTKSSDGSTQRGHMIWANSVSNDLDTEPNEEDHSLHIGPIKNVLNNDLEIDNETIRADELNIHYGNIKLYSPQVKINPNLLNLEASSEGKMSFVNTIQSEVLLRLDEISIYDTRNIYEFDIAYYGIDQYTAEQNLIISREDSSSSNDQAYYRGRKIFNNVTYDMWKWDTSDQYDRHDDNNVYILTEVITMNDEINILSDNNIVLQSPSNLKLESPGSSVTLNDEINILTDNSIIIDGSQGELKMNGDNVLIQGNSGVSITDCEGGLIQLDRSVNISSDDLIYMKNNDYSNNIKWNTRKNLSIRANNNKKESGKSILSFEDFELNYDMDMTFSQGDSLIIIIDWGLPDYKYMSDNLSYNNLKNWYSSSPYLSVELDTTKNPEQWIGDQYMTELFGFLTDSKESNLSGLYMDTRALDLMVEFEYDGDIYESSISRIIEDPVFSVWPAGIGHDSYAIPKIFNDGNETYVKQIILKSVTHTYDKTKSTISFDDLINGTLNINISPNHQVTIRSIKMKSPTIYLSDQTLYYEYDIQGEYQTKTAKKPLTNCTISENLISLTLDHVNLYTAITQDPQSFQRLSFSTNEKDPLIIQEETDYNGINITAELLSNKKDLVKLQSNVKQYIDDKIKKLSDRIEALENNPTS